MHPGIPQRAGTNSNAHCCEPISSGKILDLNQLHFPEHTIDVIVAMELLQYIRDVLALVQRCAAGTPNLIVSCPLAAVGNDIEVGRAQGCFNDFDEDAMIDMPTAAGRQITTCQPMVEYKIFVCQRDIRKSS